MNWKRRTGCCSRKNTPKQACGPARLLRRRGGGKAEAKAEMAKVAVAAVAVALALAAAVALVVNDP